MTDDWADGHAAPAARPDRPNRKPVRWGSLALIVVLAILYFSGSLDHALFNVGMNFHKCERNGYGAVFCGKELTEYEQRVVRPIEELRGER